MAFISYEPDERVARQAENLLALYCNRMTGKPDNILRIHAQNPPSMRAHFDLYSTLMHSRSDLTRTQREMIAVTVSSINECHY